MTSQHYKIEKTLLLPFALLSIANSNVIAKDYLPNIVFVLADDMGIGDIDCYYEQSKIKTPNISHWTQSAGLQFMQHYSGSTVSAPSRCCLLTGKHTGNACIRGNKAIINNKRIEPYLPKEEKTIAELLQQKGYATMCIGKWGLGNIGTSGTPNKKGFDYFFGYLSQKEAHNYYPSHLYENEQQIELNGNVYSHSLIMQKGLKFIRQQSKSQPFFAYFAITLPHADLDYPNISEYENDFKETPYVNHQKNSFKTQQKPKATYASMISEIDHNIGQLIALLKEKGMWENTILIFSSDNGVHHAGGHDPDFFNSNGPFRGYKRDLYEGGIRTPFIVSWPRVIKEHRKTPHVSAFWDFLPTICEITGIETPKDINGISYLPTLKGKEKKQKKHHYIYHEFNESGGIQSIIKDGWKLIRFNITDPIPMTEELYYLPDDIGEQHNLVEKKQKKVIELRELIKEAHKPSSAFKW